MNKRLVILMAIILIVITSMIPFSIMEAKIHPLTTAQKLFVAAIAFIGYCAAGLYLYVAYRGEGE